MDPVSVVAAAVGAGAATGLKDAAATSIKDAYSALKRLLAERYATIDVEPLERRPDSEPKRASLAEDLRDAGADSDDEILEAARRVLDEVSSHDPAAARSIGIDIEGAKAEAVRIRRVRAAGTGVRLRSSTITGDIEIEDVQAGETGPQARP